MRWGSRLRSPSLLAQEALSQGRAVGPPVFVTHSYTRKSLHSMSGGWVQERNCASLSTLTLDLAFSATDSWKKLRSAEVLLLWEESPPNGNYKRKESWVLGSNSLEWNHPLCSGRGEERSGFHASTIDSSLFYSIFNFLE